MRGRYATSAIVSNAVARLRASSFPGSNLPFPRTPPKASRTLRRRTLSMTSIPQALCLILNKAVASRRAVYSTMSSLKVMIWFRMTLLRKIYLSPLNPRLTTLTATRLTGQIVLAPSRFHSQWLCHAHNSSHQHGLDSIDQPGHLHRRPRRSLPHLSVVHSATRLLKMTAGRQAPVMISIRTSRPSALTTETTA